MFAAIFLENIVYNELLKRGSRQDAQELYGRRNLMNMLAVVIANLTSIEILIVLMMCNRDFFRVKTFENRTMVTAMTLTIIGSAVDIVDFGVDGRPGLLFSFLSLAGNSFMFVIDVVIICEWVIFQEYHLYRDDARLAKLKKLIAVIAGISFALIIVNCFTGWVFTVDENNVYHRGPAFSFFSLMTFGLMLYTCIAQNRYERRFGRVRYFPLDFFLVLIVLGFMAQLLFYGISVMCLSVAVGTVGVVASIKSEKIYIDALTGIYNRAFFDDMQRKKFSILKASGPSFLGFRKKKAASSAPSEIAGIMIDINSFKSINDSFGHSAGDNVLRDIARVLSKATGTEGAAIRYAGDEFIVILNTNDEKKVHECIEKIDDGLTQVNVANRENKCPYELSISYGWSFYYPEDESADQFLKDIDDAMYLNKKKYYEEHGRAERRMRSAKVMS